MILIPFLSTCQSCGALKLEMYRCKNTDNSPPLGDDSKIECQNCGSYSPDDSPKKETLNDGHKETEND